MSTNSKPAARASSSSPEYLYYSTSGEEDGEPTARRPSIPPIPAARPKAASKANKAKMKVGSGSDEEKNAPL